MCMIARNYYSNKYSPAFRFKLSGHVQIKCTEESARFHWERGCRTVAGSGRSCHAHWWCRIEASRGCAGNASWWSGSQGEKQLDVVAIKSELQTAFGLQRTKLGSKRLLSHRLVLEIRWTLPLTTSKLWYWWQPKAAIRLAVLQVACCYHGCRQRSGGEQC